MKRSLIIVLAVLATALSVQGQSRFHKQRRQAKAIQELRKLVQIWDQAYVSGDTATIGRLLADEFSFVGGADKRQYLASFKSRPPDSAVESAVSADVQVQIYGQAAIVTGLDTIIGKSKGKPYATRWLFMDVWIERSGRWQCVKTYSSLANTRQNALGR